VIRAAIGGGRNCLLFEASGGATRSLGIVVPLSSRA
jgi:hypothetical protein